MNSLYLFARGLVLHVRVVYLDSLCFEKTMIHRQYSSPLLLFDESKLMQDNQQNLASDENVLVDAEKGERVSTGYSSPLFTMVRHRARIRAPWQMLTG